MICEDIIGGSFVAVESSAIIDEENSYASKAKEFHSFLDTSITKRFVIKDKEEVFRCLSSIKLCSGYKLGLKIAGNSKTCYYSYFFVYDNQNKEDKNLEKYILAEPSTMGAWQIYLLMKASTVLPFYRRHGRFKQRLFIYKKTDVQVIKVFDRYDISGLLAKDFLLPKVTIVKVEESGKETTIKESELEGANGKYEADVYCCYWNDWVGLVREHVRIIINNSKVERYEVVGNFIIYHYNCGIYF
ncbi:MAG: hypothetical protein ACI3ZD_11815 [Prevotella sp.]